MPGLHDEVYPVEMGCLGRLWTPVHELGVYELVGLCLLRHHRGQEATVERRFIQGKCVVLFVRGLRSTNWACKCWLVSVCYARF